MSKTSGRESKNNGDSEVEPLLLDVLSVSRLVGIAPRTIWRYATCGKFPRPLQVGRKRLWHRRQIEEWATSLMNAGRQPVRNVGQITREWAEIDDLALARFSRGEIQ